MRILVTGSCGLIGGEAVEYFGSRGHSIVGLDNNLRREFFGPDGDTLWNLHRVAHKVPDYIHHDGDVRDGPLWDIGGQPQTPEFIWRNGLSKYVFVGPQFDAVIHCAAQPSHDKAAEDPKKDYDVNVLGTHNVLEATRRHSPRAVFIFMSTNKVYDDAVNQSVFSEYETRYDVPNWDGFDESTPTGAVGVFGQHKFEADQLVQQYARDYGMRTVVLRGGCLTGPGHSGVEQHGFLSYLLKAAILGKTYRIFGHKGKQVRDNIHSHDVMRAIEEIIKAPRSGEFYNIGGGRENSISILEAINKVESMTGLKMMVEHIEEPRVGDHICYISNTGKLRAHYPRWSVSKSLDATLEEMVQRDYWDRYSDGEDTKAYDLGPDSVVLDIGGYRGAWTTEMVARYNPNMYVFEPCKEFYDECAIRFARNEKVHLFNIGLSNRDDQVTLLGHAASKSAFCPDAGSSEVVNVGDATMALGAFERVDLMSLNCEGAEFEILPTLIETGQITKVRNLQVQFHRFYPGADVVRESIRVELAKTHVEMFNHPWVWESWRLKT